MRRPVVLGLLVLTVLSACAQPQPVGRRVVLPPRTAPAEPAERGEASWSFSIANGVCSASLVQEGVTLAVAAGPGRDVTYTAQAGRRISQVAFRGTEGNWQLRFPGTATRVTRRLDAAGERRLRAMLAGGTLRYSRPGARVLAVAVPDAGISGRDWFGCVSALQSAPPAPRQSDADAPA
ncbi:hypothetical protein [Falsiroseomonas tokyonensis]|uniref:Lipoprotein n=1 Tax=Falsiroseomonas tokyonensis TaxID=430521 RepID=A0ABV7BVD5_9PROT|nr:hypothetical protein [Falsiroseomonas tokyonensis]MBU8537960.1 hypothetical protein [Falsiroseomonas tokyonensis]